MAEFLEYLLPYGVLVGWVSRRESTSTPSVAVAANPNPAPPARQTTGVDTYLSQEIALVPVRHQQADAIDFAAPDEWKPYVASVLKIDLLDEANYRHERYFVRFSQANPGPLFALIKNRTSLESLSSAIRHQTNAARGDTLRADRSGAQEREWTAAILTIFDLVAPADSDGVVAFSDSDAAEEIKRTLGHDDPRFLTQPTRLGPLLMTIGCVAGTPLDSASIFRDDVAPLTTDVLLPKEAVDWADISDAIYIIRDLTSQLRREGLATGAIDSHLPSVTSPEVVNDYDEFTRLRASAIRALLQHRELVNRIGSDLAINLLGPTYASSLDGKPIFGERFHRRVVNDYEKARQEFDAAEANLSRREQQLSAFYREAASWSASRTLIALAEKTRELSAASLKFTESATGLQKDLLSTAKASREITDSINRSTESTDKLTRQVKWYTVVLVILTFLAVVIGVLPDRMKERWFVSLGWMTEKAEPEQCPKAHSAPIDPESIGYVRVSAP